MDETDKAPFDQKAQMDKQRYEREVKVILYEPVHEISTNVVCAASKASDQPVHMPSLVRAFASRLSIP